MKFLTSKLINFLIELTSTKQSFKIFIIIFIETVLSLLSFLISAYLIFDKFYLIELINNKVLFVFPFIFIILFYFSGLYSSIFRYINFYLFLKFFVLFLLYLTILPICILLLKPQYFNFSFILLNALLFFNSIIFFRYLIYKVIKSLFPLNNNIKKIAIYGTDELAFDFAKNSTEFKVEFFIDNDHNIQNRKIVGKSIFNLKEFKSNKLFNEIEMIIIAKKDLNYFGITRIYEELSSINIPIKIYNKFSISEQNINENFLTYSMNNFTNRNIEFETNDIMKKIKNKSVLITGGGGSIGSELAKQILFFEPSEIVIVDYAEYNLFNINNDLSYEIAKKQNKVQLRSYLCSLINYSKLKFIIEKHKPNFVFHAAAYKHVNILEKDENIDEAINNNILGTYNLLKILNNNYCDEFIFISTDKAIKPLSVMGYTKKYCEIICQKYLMNKNNNINKITIVRFGNVIGSAGSVLPLFNYQIKNRLPVTVTHKDATRYFMTIQEAVGLVLQTTTLSDNSSIYMLKMGEPIKILDIAKKLIQLHGFNEGNSNDSNKIEIKFTGLNKGEKIHEDLFDQGEFEATSHPDIFLVKEKINSNNEIDKNIEIFKQLISNNKIQELKLYLRDILD